MNHKDAYIRYKLIDARLRKKPFPTLLDIVIFVTDKSECSVSTSSIQKDIFAMRYNMKLEFFAPIEYDKKLGVYFYSDADYTIDVNELVTQNKKLLEKTKVNLTKTDVSGSLPLDKSHICYEKGHNMFLVTELDNGRSKYGDHKCSRCGHVESFQYDYGHW